jgi:uncharacterized membrane protein
MSKPRPEDYPTLSSYLWAKHRWRRRTGWNMIVTVLICLFFGAVSGSAVGLLLLLAFGVGLHLWVRHTRG